MKDRRDAILHPRQAALESLQLHSLVLPLGDDLSVAVKRAA